MIMTVAQIIDGLGGSAATARMLGKERSTVSEMKRRRSIPVRYWQDIVAQYREIGIDLTYDIKGACWRAERK